MSTHATADSAAAESTKSRRISVGSAALDCTFLAVVVAISLLPYVTKLGFYYDDYSVLERMGTSHDHSLLGLYHAVRPGTGQRPLQALTFATLYRFFGLAPLGYHIVNACLLVGVAGLLYLVLRELRLPRLVSVAVPLVYSTLPHYATDRFWLDAFQVNVSTAFYLLSLYASLRAVRACSGATLVSWLAVAALGVAGSLFAYEVIFPLFVLNVALVWLASRKLPESSRGRSSRRAVVGSRRAVVGFLVATVITVGLAKTALVAEYGQNNYRVGFQDGLLHHLAYLVFGAIKVNLGTYLVAVPYVLGWIVWHRFSASGTAAAALSGLLSFAYLWRIGYAESSVFLAKPIWRKLVRVGVIIFVLGYAIFLTNGNILFRSAGLDNRVNAAAALGVAGVLIGATGFLARRAGQRYGAAVFSATIAFAVASGVFIVDSLATYWTAAARQQHAIITAVKHEGRVLTPSGTVVLDGVCPELGPAVVFADQWDLRGALQLALHDRSVTADVAAEGLRATADGLSVQMSFLGDVSSRRYPYGRLFVYDFRDRRLYRLSDRSRAAAYIAHARPSFRCPPQRGFAWGSDPQRRWSLP